MQKSWKKKLFVFVQKVEISLKIFFFFGQKSWNKKLFLFVQKVEIAIKFFFLVQLRWNFDEKKNFCTKNWNFVEKKNFFF